MSMLKFHYTHAGAHKMDSRIIGVHVVCGTINGLIFYYTDQLIGHGGNLTVEVIRQALSDLAALLASKNQIMPKKGTVALDNGGENKCKQVFVYLAVLVESRCMTDNFLHFLIVGHTHNPLDQVFSTIAAYIREALFLGTPLAIEAILREKLPQEYQPLLVKKIRISYDFLKAFAPYISKVLKYYALPQLFHFCLRHLKAVMFYKMLSTLPFWQPNEPADLKDRANLPEVSVVANNYSLLGGREYFFAHFGIDKDQLLAQMDLHRELVLNLLQFETHVMPEIFKGWVETISDRIEASLAAFGEELYGHDLCETDVTFQDMIAASNKDEGYMLWLTNPDPQLLESVLVLPILPTMETILAVENSHTSRGGGGGGGECA